MKRRTKYERHPQPLQKHNHRGAHPFDFANYYWDDDDACCCCGSSWSSPEHRQCRCAIRRWLANSVCSAGCRADGCHRHWWWWCCCCPSWTPHTWMWTFCAGLRMIHAAKHRSPAWEMNTRVWLEQWHEWRANRFDGVGLVSNKKTTTHPVMRLFNKYTTGANMIRRPELW